MAKRVINQRKRFKESRENKTAAVRVGDFRSDSLSAKMTGVTTGRIHHLHSILEQLVFILCDYDKRVVDIEDQYPLEIEETRAIAKALDIRHPRIPGTAMLNMFTTDLVLTLTDGRKVALNVKYEEDLEDPRVLEKMKVEANYWHRHGAVWLVVTEREVDLQTAVNCFHLLNLDEPGENLLALSGCLIEGLKESSCPVRAFTNRFEDEHHLRRGEALFLFKHLIKTGELPFDLTLPLQNCWSFSYAGE